MNNTAYVITKSEIEYYMSLMENDEANIQRDGLQKLFQEMQKGRRMTPFFRKQIEPDLERLILSPVPKVRKWALHLATELNSHKIMEVCISQLGKEDDTENVNWILAVLSKDHTKAELLDLMRREKTANPLLDAISELQIKASTALFSKEHVEGVPMIVQDLRHSDPKIRSWLTKLYGYHALAQERDMDDCVTQKDMLDLITDGDPGLQEYGMWGLYTHGAQDFDFRRIPQDLLDPSSYHDDTLKWFFPLVQYIPKLASDQDQIASWIRSRTSLNRSAREGVLNLILHLDFSPKYVKPLVDWYIEEESDSVKRLLIQYMASNVEQDKTESFFAIIEGEFCNSAVRTLIECEIRLNPETTLEIVGGTIQPKKGGPGMEKSHYPSGSQGVGQINQTFPTNIHVSEGSTINVNLQQGSINLNQSPAVPPAFDYQVVASFLAEVERYKLSTKELGNCAVELQEVLEKLKSAVNKREEPSKIKNLLEAMRDLAIGVSGSLIASGISAQILNLIQQLGL